MYNIVIGLKRIIEKDKEDSCEGLFYIGSKDLVLHREFTFFLEHPKESNIRLVIFKDDSPFVDQRGNLTEDWVKSLERDKFVILTSFTALFRAFKGELKEIGNTEAVKIVTPIQDELIEALQSACS